MTSSQRRPYADILDQHIHSCNQLTSILAKLEANAAGADDAVLLDTAGMLAETSSTHLFLVRDGQVITSTTRACPEGITRSVVLEICREINVTADVRDVPADELPTADEMFVTGTMGEITPVARFDDRVMPSMPGPVTAKIAERFRQRTHDPAEGLLIVDT